MSGNSTNLPKVTVIIPLHNHAEYILTAIRSVTEQDYPLIQVCISDDGSTDGGFEFLKNELQDITQISDQHFYGFYDKVLITVIRSEIATGPSAARNRAIHLTWDDTDIFAMLDADDTYLPGKISRSVDKMSDENVGLTYTDAIICNLKTGTKIHEFRQPYNRDKLEQECIVSNTPMIAKKAFETCGLYNESMRTAEDWELWLRITKFFLAIHIPEPLHTYSVTGKNASDVVDPKVWQDNWDKIRKLLHEQV